MIISEYFRTREDGVILNRTYSDAGFLLLQNETGIYYSDPIDVAPCAYTYTETNIPVDSDENQATEEDYQNALTEMGVDLYG